MSLSIEIQKKEKIQEKRKVRTSSEVFNLKEVQEIKDAVQEHLLFIGLDSKNNIRNISLLGVGTSRDINVDSKYIVRNALVTASDKVILVHNHPSNELEPSIHDRHISNVVYKLLKAYNIQFTDHIIVGEHNYLSMGERKDINKDYVDDRTIIIDLIEENKTLREQNKLMYQKLKRYERVKREIEEELE